MTPFTIRRRLTPAPTHRPEDRMTTLTARLTIRAGRRRLDVELHLPAPAGRPRLTIRTGNRTGRTPDVRPESTPVLINYNRPAPPSRSAPPRWPWPPPAADVTDLAADAAAPARPAPDHAPVTITFDPAAHLDPVSIADDYQRAMIQQRARRTA